ncbi:MAG: response regulator transcription factor [Acidobacteriota bacterium]|nr:response regulator transcription factor [Acidobacteriota bacterium]
MAIKILIADDHAIVRQGLRQIVTADPDLTVVGEAQNGTELLNLIRNTEVDVVVLDISMPGRNGLETLKDIKADYPSMPVIVLSMYPEDQYAVRVFKAGAASYITKETAPEELVKAIKKAHHGGKYISQQLAELLASYIEAGTNKEPHKTLSDREYEVFCLLAAGKTVGQISEEFNLSVKTVSTYRARILEKMGMTTNAEMMRYAITNKLV